MAILQFELPLRPLVGLYARIVQRELGLLRGPGSFPREIPKDKSLFARSVAVALGQSFARGGFVRKEFAQALYQRFQTYKQLPEFPWFPPVAEVVNHASTLVHIVAGISDRGRVEISDYAVAKATENDYRELLQLGMDPMDYSPEGPLGPLWREAAPLWWGGRPETPDQWVNPMTKLGAPIWASEQLSGDSLTYLVKFGLDRVESKPGLIERWTETVPLLVANASKPNAKISRLLDCCRVDP